MSVGRGLLGAGSVPNLANTKVTVDPAAPITFPTTSCVFFGPATSLPAVHDDTPHCTKRYCCTHIAHRASSRRTRTRVGTRRGKKEETGRRERHAGGDDDTAVAMIAKREVTKRSYESVRRKAAARRLAAYPAALFLGREELGPRVAASKVQCTRVEGAQSVALPDTVRIRSPSSMLALLATPLGAIRTMAVPDWFGCTGSPSCIPNPCPDGFVSVALYRLCKYGVSVEEGREENQRKFVNILHVRAMLLKQSLPCFRRAGCLLEEPLKRKKRIEEGKLLSETRVWAFTGRSTDDGCVASSRYVEHQRHAVRPCCYTRIQSV